MSKLQKQFLRVEYIDELARQQSPVHSVEPLAKLITTLFFIITVVSFDRYSLTPLFPFLLFPVVMISVGGLPLWYIVKSVLIVSPFAVLVGIFNPIIDHSVVAHVFGVDITGGWLSFLSILLRFVLTVSSVLVLISLTGFNSVCGALERLRVPKPFVVQLMFLYRYLFLLVEEAGRMIMARTLRSFGRGDGFRVYTSLLGHLLLRAMDRAQRIHLAMYSRGFSGNIHMIKRSRFGLKDALFVIIWVSIFILFRIYNIPLLLGGVFTGLAS
ncbi:cobalt ABC transporter, inner membrane subunit CbiQ [Denitrovibrio acetiphilus DSM 12809]|uniref:Cobalt ABC transporter, inner membrane subunit CbiQ n=1 Tax=Denitrovibrio acetiphilus (strain DSM 12809 / NBRC 114555 / N2460) TaxID=522772 RepID=D4H2P5_DENA2|nr:cobalt ECF transporter T component CbiQ [Denitrovibrio acetiphilus]ADD67106.1 cobalt ABC transporter, inner membrane subunit CbiQ [Denitrovibrio acetiphilus DSM 12809]